MGDTFHELKVGVVQAASVFLDREGSVAKAISYIEQAGAAGVDLLAFPESFIPAHPLWYHFQPATGKQSLALATRLFENAVEIPGPAADALCQAAANARVNVVIGVCEKRPRTTGTLFNTQLFIGREGRILGKHQKLTPTVGERLVHSGGYGDTLQAIETDVGIVSSLICAENWNPLAIFALAAQGAQIHVASWPNHFPRDSSNTVADLACLAGRALAYTTKCFVLNACGTISDEMRALCPYVDEDREFLANPENGGGSCIIAPNSQIIAGPMSGREEGLLLASIHLRDSVKGKVIQDFTGHYNRPDIFELSVSREVPELFRWRAPETREDVAPTRTVLTGNGNLHSRLEEPLNHDAD